MARPSKPGNTERGWNDPPMFLHTPTVGGTPAQTAPPPRTLLNKRVAHPGISGSASSGPKASEPLSKNAPPPLMPPMCNVPPAGVGNVILFPPSSTVTALPAPAPIIIPNMAPPLSPTGVTGPPLETLKDEIEVPDFGDDNQMFLFVTSHLNRVHRECSALLSMRVSDEITKKLEVFETMWESGKISYPVKAAMARLSIALCRRQCDLAHEIHMGLMMDYVSEVGQWMVGIKRLIQEARNVSPVGSPDNSQRAPPSFIKPSEDNVTGAEGESSAAQSNGEDSKEDQAGETTTDSTPLVDQETVGPVKDGELNSETRSGGEGS